MGDMLDGEPKLIRLKRLPRLLLAGEFVLASCGCLATAGGGEVSSGGNGAAFEVGEPLRPCSQPMIEGGGLVPNSAPGADGAEVGPREDHEARRV